MLKSSSIKALITTLFLTFFLTACGSDANPEEATVKNYINAIASGDADKAMAMIYIPEKEKENAANMAAISGKIKATLIEMKEKQFDPKGGLTSIEITNKEFSDNKEKVTLFYTLNFKNGTTEGDHKIRLILDNGVWKVELK